MTTPVPHHSFVTGATGLLGSQLVRQLLAGGGMVTALVRDLRRARRLLPDDPRLRRVVGDICEPSSYHGHLYGTDTVFHTAAYFREYYEPRVDRERLHRTNVTALTELLPASADAGVPVVVYISSTTVLRIRGGDAGDGTELIDEDSPPARISANGYRESKLAAERMIANWVARSNQRVSIILPAWMWAPGDAGPTSAGRLFLAVARGKLPVVPNVGHHVVDARDVADACIRAAAEGRNGRRYVVAGRWHSLPEVCAGIVSVTGCAVPRAVPAHAALAVSTVLEWQARIRRRPPIATRKGVTVLVEGHRARYSSARAEKELGVRFRPLQDTLADEAARYREHGQLP